MVQMCAISSDHEVSAGWFGICESGCEGRGVGGGGRKTVNRRRPAAGGAEIWSAYMAMDFPIDPVDRLPIFLEGASSVVAHIGLLGQASSADGESTNASHGDETATTDPELRELPAAHSLFGQIGSGVPFAEQPSVAAVGGAMSAFSESEGDSADVMEQEVVEGPVHGEQLAVARSRPESQN